MSMRNNVNPVSSFNRMIRQTARILRLELDRIEKKQNAGEPLDKDERIFVRMTYRAAIDQKLKFAKVERGNRQPADMPEPGREQSAPITPEELRRLSTFQPELLVEATS